MGQRVRVAACVAWFGICGCYVSTEREDTDPPRIDAPVAPTAPHPTDAPAAAPAPASPLSPGGIMPRAEGVDTRVTAEARAGEVVVPACLVVDTNGNPQMPGATSWSISTSPRGCATRPSHRPTRRSGRPSPDRRADPGARPRPAARRRKQGRTRRRSTLAGHSAPRAPKCARLAIGMGTLWQPPYIAARSAPRITSWPRKMTTRVQSARWERYQSSTDSRRTSHWPARRAGQRR